MNRTDEYYTLLGKIEKSRSNDNYDQMLVYCEKTLPLLQQLVEDWIVKDGALLINSIPAIELGCMFWAITNNHLKLDAVKTIVNSVPELREGWGSEVEKSYEIERVSCTIQTYVKDHPGTIQSKLKDLIKEPIETISEVAYWLHRLGKLRRVKSGRSYELYLIQKDNLE